MKQTLAAWRKELWPWCDAVGRKREAVQLAHPSNVKEIGMQEGGLVPGKRELAGPRTLSCLGAWGLPLLGCCARWVMSAGAVQNLSFRTRLHAGFGG